MPRLSHFTIVCVLISVLLLCLTFLLTRRPCPLPCPCPGLSMEGQDLRQPGAAPQPQTTPVHIFEEHHEALLYWIPAAKNGAIPPTGNTLIHIDAHSDFAVPFEKDILPVGRLPRDAQELSQMMQRNDVFVQAAILTGLFNKVIWIHPTWLKDNFSDEQDPKLSHGVIYVEEGGKTKQQVCTCTSNNVCSYFTGSDIEDYREHMIKRSQCDIKVTLSYAIVPEDKAASYLRRHISPGESIVLDIDEDFYGTEAAGTPFYNVGLTEMRANLLSSFVYAIFCPTTVLEERAGDSFFYHMISKLKHIKEFCAGSGLADCGVNATTLLPELWRELARRGIEKFLCRKKAASPKDYLQVLLRVLSRYTAEQLEAMRTVGICTATSLRTFNVSASLGMVLCEGSNTPNHTMVEFHTPSWAEVASRTAGLRGILAAIGSAPPRLVTVCRSGRDGYTPRAMLSAIESDIVSALKDSFGTVTDNSVFYDSNLLGGKEGWFSRYDVFMSIP